MTVDELLEKILAILPNATIGDDNDGQIVIYTNLIESENSELVEMEDAQ